ncbi:hypothetical protein [Nocardioides dongxiaopingii]|uniref:hypothetical protein n=1 Tax=Nocardioides dongxiaopingii TaxID=2576036 RepID=UPI0010C762B9|nr:hypothetical protein [Nocardioides dongxiaopingii]
MYVDNAPCSVCGSPVELRARTGVDDPGGPVGDPDGYVGDADSTPDERVCTNADCPTRTSSVQA